MKNSIVIIGEAWGDQEALLQAHFVGAAGQELARMLFAAGYGNELLSYSFNSPARMLGYWRKFPYPLLNVFNARLPDNDITFFYTKPGDAASKLFPQRKFDNSIYYVKAEHEHHIIHLHETLSKLKPNVIVALGNTALWALGLPPSVSKLRGNVVDSDFGKVLPTFHPASVLRKWEQRVVTILDLHKALRESSSPFIKTISREIWTKPTIDDLYKWWALHGTRTGLLAFDIETVGNKQISEISFAVDSTHALHIPFFWKENRRFINWWPAAKTELEAWRFVKMVLERDIPKI